MGGGHGLGGGSMSSVAHRTMLAANSNSSNKLNSGVGNEDQYTSGTSDMTNSSRASSEVGKSSRPSPGRSSPAKTGSRRSQPRRHGSAPPRRRRSDGMGRHTSSSHHMPPRSKTERRTGDRKSGDRRSGDRRSGGDPQRRKERKERERRSSRDHSHSGSGSRQSSSRNSHKKEKRLLSSGDCDSASQTTKGLKKERVRDRDRHKSIPHVPKGLKNVGNTCYANAALQCLLATTLSHALLDPSQAVLFRRYSSNQNILAAGSGSVDSELDEDYEFEDQIGLSIDISAKKNAGTTANDATKMPTALPTSPSEEEKTRKKEERRIKREIRRKEKLRKDSLATCHWLTDELTDIARQHTTLKDRPDTEVPEPPEQPVGILAGLLSIGGPFHTPKPEPVVDPGPITRNVNKLSTTLRPYQQEDSHEFLRSLLATLTMEGQNRQLSALFDGLLESAVTCQTCNTTSLTRDRYMDLSLDITDCSIKSLPDALKHFTKSETLDADNMVDCRKCQERRIVSKGLRLATAPTILVCHLKRFAWNSYGQHVRLNKEVPFPTSLSIGDYMSLANRSTPAPYELAGVVVHAGRSCDSGHYYSFVRSGSRWYKCNDDVVTEVDLAVVLKQKAYILVYEVEGMRERHGCETFSKYHAPPEPPKVVKKDRLSRERSRRMKKYHIRSQSAPRPVREPSPAVQRDAFPFRVFRDNSDSEEDGAASTALNAIIDMLNVCDVNNMFGDPEEATKSNDFDGVNVRHDDSSWDPTAASDDDEVKTTSALGCSDVCVPGSVSWGGSTLGPDGMVADREIGAFSKPPLSPQKRKEKDATKRDLGRRASRSASKPTGSEAPVSPTTKYPQATWRPSGRNPLMMTKSSSTGNLKDAVDQTSNISRETKVHARRRRLKGIKRESNQRRQSARQKEISVDEKPPLKNGDEEKLPNQKPPLPN